MATPAKDPTPPASTDAGVSGGESKVETPVTPPPAPPEPKAVSPAEALMELEHRGFTTAQELVDMIKRYDNVIKESRLEQENVALRQEELNTTLARFEEREEQLRKKAEKVLALRKEVDDRMETIEKRLAVLTKLEP